jgi:hypothetical protein
LDSIAPIDQGGEQARAGKEVAGELVVSAGDGTEVLDAAVGALDDIAPLVALGVEEEAVLAIGFVGDDGDGAAAVEESARMVGVVALVADQPSAGGDVAQQRRRDGDVGDVAAG